MQILMEKSDEGSMRGLGFIQGQVKKFKADKSTRVPHMGWKTVTPVVQSGMYQKLFNDPREYYFCHSFYAEVSHNIMIGSSEHGHSFLAALAQSNILGVQFHPEKSHDQGLELLYGFANCI